MIVLGMPGKLRSTNFLFFSFLRESTIFQEWERSAERIFWQET